MKTLLLFILVCFPLSSQAEDAKICLNMIVKNEAQVIKRCLESTKQLIDYWIIVDTGSTDGTQEIIKEFMKDIPGELHERPWVNFAHNRNEALNLAKNKADYVLIIDADDRLEIAPEFIRPALTMDGYHLQINHHGSTHYRPHLVKTDLDWQWGGVVHEALFSHEIRSIGILEGVIMVIVGGGHRSGDPKKFEKDAQILEEALQEDPTSTRNVFYLAQSYHDAGQLEKAIATYQKRVDMGGWEQEVFWSLYQIGIIQEALGLPEQIISKSYAEAYRYRPCRIEPLYRLCYHYRKQENYAMGYLIAQYGIQAEQPNDPLFVESWIYDYGLLLEYSICAYWIGEYKEALIASNRILARKNLPQHVKECVERNLTFIHYKLAY
jgi:glycosyltransferase involved in cell wall biosynthesis